jgi:hypothetical protein
MSKNRAKIIRIAPIHLTINTNPCNLLSMSDGELRLTKGIFAQN